ncbi:Protein of unknown function, partial [Gryllus bimaculatus]
CVCY